MEEIAEVTTLPLDAFFTPVTGRLITIQTKILVDDSPNYEKIVFDIETDGQISPVDAFINALETMYKQLSVFNGVSDVR